MTRRLQNKISESTLTLPVASVVTVLVWFVRGLTWSSGVTLFATALVAYLLMEMDAQNALLRIRSRMIPAVWLMLASMLPVFHALGWMTLAVCCMAASFYSLFRTTREHEPVSDTFRSSLFLSIASLVWPPLLLLIPLQWWSQSVFLRTMTLRSLCAAILGCIMPYFLWASWAFFTEWNGGLLASYTLSLSLPPCAGNLHVSLQTSLQAVTDHLTAIAEPLVAPASRALRGEIPLADCWLSLNQELVDADRDVRAVVTAHARWLHDHWLPLASTTYILMMGLTAYIHYMRKNFDDKITVRMQFYSFLLMQAVLTLWFLLDPPAWHRLFPLIVMVSAVPIAHLFALTKTWLTNAWFVVCLLAWAAILSLQFLLP